MANIFDQFDKPSAPATPTLQSPRSFARAAGDTALGLGQGVESVGMFVPQLANTLTGGAVDKYLFKPATGAVDKLLGGPGEGRTLAEASQATHDALDELKSPQLRQKEQELADTKGFFPTIKKVVTDPALLVDQGAQQIPQLVVPGGLVRKAGAVAFERAAGSALAKGVEKRVAAGMTEEAATQAAQKVANRVGRTAAIGAGATAVKTTEALMSGSQNSEQAQQEVMGMDQKVLDANPDYQALIASGVSPKDAREKLAMQAGIRAGAAAAALTYATSGITGRLESKIFQGETGLEGVGKLLSGTGAKELAKATGKEFTQEALQEGGEQFGQNLGVQSVDPNKDLMDQVPEQAALGGVVGGVLGGGTFAGSAAMARPHNAVVPNPGAAPGSLSEAANVLAEPAGPLGRAAQAAQAGGLRPNEAGAEAAGVPPVPAPAPAAQSPLQAAVAEYHATAAQADASGIPPDVFIDRLAQKHGASAQGLWNAVTGDRAAPADTITEPAAPAPASAALPWVNATTGEVGKPTKGQLTQVLADHIVQTFDTQGHMRINADDLATQWGVTKKMINQVRPAAQEAANNRVRAAQNPALNEPSGNAGQLPGATDGNERVPGAEAAAPATAGAEAAGQANAEPAAVGDHGPDRGADQPDTAVPAAVAGPNAAGDANAAVAPAAASGETAAAKKEPSSAEKPNGLPGQPKAQVDGVDRAPGRAGGEGQGGAASEAAPRVSSQAPEEKAASPRAGVPAPETAQPAPAVATTKTPPAGGVSGSSESVNPVQAALRAMATGQHPEKALTGADDSTVRAVAKAMGRTFSAKASTRAIVERLGEQPASEWRGQAEKAMQAKVPAAPAHKVSAAAREAEGLRIKTADGETNGRSHVDSLIKDGFTKVDSRRTGDKMVHTMVNAAGEHKPIKARQLKYAQEASARHAEEARQQLDAAAHEAATSPHNDKPEPTQPQIEAGNYEKGHITVHGLDISIENPKGSTRSGVGEDGKPWSHVMSDHYGYIRRTTGADGEHVDTYVGPHPDSKRVYVVDQLNQKTGAFDEHKVMLGFRTQGEAVRAYRSNFDPGWKVGKVKDMTVDQFKAWLKDGDTTKPAATAPTVKESLTVEPAAPATTEKSSTVAGKQAPKRGGIATNGAKVRVVGGKLQYVPRAPETLAAYFKPGDVVPSYGGQDRVISTDFSEAGNPLVRVIAVDKDGNTKPNERERVHGTMPTERELVAKLGKPVLAEKAPKAAKAAAESMDTAAAAGRATPPALDDFGERLEGARKFMPPSLKEVLGDDVIASQPLSKFWPADAYLGIENPEAAALAFAARAAVPAKPRLARRVRVWVEQVKLLREIMSNADDRGGLDALEKKATAMGYGQLLREFFPKARLLAQLPRETWGRVERAAEYPGAIRYNEDGKRIEIPFSAVTIDGKTHHFEGAGRIGPDEVARVKDLLAGEENTKPAALTAADFEIRSYRGRAEAFINRKGDAERRSLKTFTGQDKKAVVAEARAWLGDNVPALEKAWEAVKARDNVSKTDTRRKENRPRVGVDRRGGKDVTPAMFEQALGFRGVQFGNWVGQGKGAKDRQGMLNEAYDALLDLADLLGIPSRAISLNGSLGLALGARGAGRNNAHFEPSNLVINLTKTKGAGSLAHEWFHALDNYFSRLRGGEVPFNGNQDDYRRNNYITYKPEPAWVNKTSRAMPVRTSADLRTLLRQRGMWDEGKSLEQNAEAAGWQRDQTHKQGVRPEVERAFADLVQALNDSPMAARVRKLDKSAGGYWHRIIERGARTFENYVISKLALNGQSNDFLANVTDWKAWAERGKNMDRYPYLRPEEEAPVVAAFDKLFDTVQAREDDAGNVALFSIDRAGAAVDGRVATTLADARNAASQFIGKPIANDNGLVPATVSGVTLGKMLSDSAVRKSTSVVDHVRAVANLDTLYRMGMLDETHADKHGEPTIAAIHRVVAPMVGENGEVLAVKMTVKETTHPGMPNPLYSVETLEVDSTEGVKPARKAPQSGIEREPGQGRHSPQAGFSPDVTRMLEEFKRKLPLFRQTNDTTTAAAPVTAAQEAHTARIKQIATAAMGKWKGDDVPALRVVATPEQLPAAAKVAANGLASNAYKTAAGMYDGRTIWIVASAHKTDQAGIRRILTTMAHEGVGHYGVERIVERELGAGAWAKIETATERLRANPELASQAIRAVLDDVGKRYRGADAPTFAKEFLAVTAERGVKNGLLDRVVTAIRQWLRRVMPDLRLSEHELRQLLVQSDQYLRVGESQQQRVQSRAAMAFSQNRPALEPVAAQAEAYRTSLSNAMKVGGRTDRPIPIGDAPAWLRAVGGSDHGLSIRKDTVLKATEGERRPGTEVNHDVRMRDIERLPELLADPVMAFKSRTQKNAMVAMLDAKDMSGRQIVAALHLNAADGRYEVHRVASVYGKDGVAGFVREDLRAGRLLYRNEQKSHEWLQSVGLQLPGEEATRGRGDTVVTDGDLVNSAQFSRSDQTDAPAFKRWFGESKVVDPAGNPLPVFHGTADDFSAFDPNRSGSTTAHMTAKLGSFFAEDRAKAQHYAENASQGVPAEERVIDAYLSIQKPYTMSLKEFQALDSQEESTALRKKLQAEGYDGIHLKEVGQWVAFTPSQIKSASENRGTFDPGNPNIYFSRSAESVDTLDSGQQVQQETLVQRAKDWVAGKFEDLLPSALSLLQRRHLTELMAGQAPLRAATQYDEMVQQLDADRAQLLSGAPDAAEHPGNMLKAGAAVVAQELREFTHEKGVAGWFGRKTAQGRQLAEVMHESTIKGIDPSKTYQRLQMKSARGEWVDWTPQLVKERIAMLKEQMLGRSADDKTAMMDEIRSLRSLKSREKQRQQAYPQLVAKYQALPPAGKALYQKMRDWYEQMSDATADALEARIMALRGDMEESQGKEVAERQTRMLVQKLRAEFEENKVTGVYFPLTRNGAYWVSYKDKAGDQGFQRFETASAQKKWLKELSQKGGAVLATGRMDGNLRAKDAPSGTFIAEIIATMKKSGAPEKVQDEVYQTFLRTLPEVSMRKHAIHRKATPGFSDDITRGFAQNAYHGAHQLARLRWAHRLQTQVDNMQKNMDAARKLPGADPAKIARADALLGELKRRHDAIMSPNDTQVANTLNGIGFLYYMGASPASALVNLTQNAQVTLPVLGAHHGWGKASRMLGAAMRDSMRTGGNIQRTLTDEEELRAYNALRARGDIDKTQSHTMAGLAEGSLLQANPVYAKVMNGLTWMFHQAEVVNREAAGIAAYRLARSRGDDFNAAVQYASDIINGTHFDYSAANRPRIMQGNTARVALQFKNYSASMTWMLYRNLYQSFKGESPEVRSVARKTLTGILGMTSLFAGVMGLPIINVVRAVAGAAHAAAGDDDEPWDFNTEFRKWLAEHLGDNVANWVADGAVSQVTGANIASRVGMADLWFHDEDRALEGKDAFYNYLEGAVGPMAGLAKNIFIGTDMINKGHTWRGFETMMPKFAKDAMKATRFAHEGVNSLRGDPIMADVSVPEMLIQGLGFQPTALREQQRINSALMNYSQAVRDRRATLLNAYAMAWKEGDTAAVSKTMDKISAFNDHWPEIAIKSGTIRDSLRQRAKLSAQAENGIMLDRRIGARIKQEVGGAATTE